MIKIRNKRIALLLVLAMLVTMFASVGTASAASNFIDVDSNYTVVNADDDSIDQDAGDIRVIANADFAHLTASDVSTIYVELSFPDSMDLADYDSTPNAELSWSLDDYDDQTLVFSCPGSALGNTPGGVVGTDDRIFDLTGTSIYVDEDATGNISVSARVYAKKGSAIVFDETENNVIAKVTSSDLTTSAASAKSVYVGSDQKGAAITVKEAGPTAFRGNYVEDDVDSYGKIKFTILTSGVTWDDPDIKGTYVNAGYYDDTDKAYTVEYWDDDETQTSKVVFTPYFKISPAASAGDVKVRVSGDGIDSEEYVVATIGEGGVAISVKDADEDFIYRGQFATFDDVTVTLDPEGDELDDTDWFSITLPAGLKFANVSEPVTITKDDNKVYFEGLIKNDKTVWFTVNSDNLDDKFKVSDFALVADADAALGDLTVTFAGAVEGTAVIGSVKDAFTVATTPFALQAGMTGAAGPDIVITETADGALKTSFDWDNDNEDGYNDVDEDLDYDEEFNVVYGAFGIVLPAGVTFDGVPDVDVTDGDLEISNVQIGEDYRELWFNIDEKSNIASTITISNIHYTVLSQPGLGDLKANIGGAGAWDYSYNIYSSKPLATAVVGSVATNPTAVYVIGAPTFTVNGAVNSVVAPSYVKNDRTYLAIRDITTGLGIDPTNVLWDEANQRVTMIKGDKIVQVTIGSNLMYVNGVAIAMDVAPEMGPTFRSMLPAAFIAQAFGATATWDGLTSTVTIK